MSLDNIVAVQKRHLTIGFDPNFMLTDLCEYTFFSLGNPTYCAIECKVIKSGDVKSELAGLGEFTKASANRSEVIASSADG